jgi:hypothetical protein
MEASLSRRGAGMGHGLSRYSKHTDQIQSARTGYVRASPRADPDVFAQSAKTTEVFALAIGGRQRLSRQRRETVKACSKRSLRERCTGVCCTEVGRQVFVREAKNIDSLLPP